MQHHSHDLRKPSDAAVVHQNGVHTGTGRKSKNKTHLFTLSENNFVASAIDNEWQ